MLWTAPALAQDAPATGNLTTSAEGRLHGESLAVAGGGCLGSTEVELTIADGVPIGTTTAGASGDFATNVVIPYTIPTGDVALNASCSVAGGGTLVLSRSLLVTEGAERANATDNNTGIPSFLPRADVPTDPAGSNPLVSTALVLAIIGAAVGGLSFARRREYS